MTRNYDEPLAKLVRYTGAWATAELLRGLLKREDVLNLLADGATVAEISQTAGASERQVASLLMTLEVEDVVRPDDRGVWTLSEFGQALRDRRGWLEMLIDGYGGFFRHSEALWGGQQDPAWREMTAVGRGSVAISRHGALPLVIELMEELNPEGETFVDVGCANADYLIELCKSSPRRRGVGVEPAEALRAEARTSVAAAGLADRIQIIASVDDIRAEVAGDPDFFIFGFALHELVEQRGVDWVHSFLKRLGTDFPGAWILVVEADVTARGDVERMRSDSHLRGYYNPYYLLHDFTDQTLLERSQWMTVFDTAGLHVHEVRAIDPRFDPTGMEIAFVVRGGDANVTRRAAATASAPRGNR